MSLPAPIATGCTTTDASQADRSGIGLTTVALGDNLPQELLKDLQIFGYERDCLKLLLLKEFDSVPVIVDCEAVAAEVPESQQVFQDLVGSVADDCVPDPIDPQVHLPEEALVPSVLYQVVLEHLRNADKQCFQASVKSQNTCERVMANPVSLPCVSMKRF